MDGVANHWYSGLGATTATFTPTTTSSPDWDQAVVCLPAATVAQPVKLSVANGGATGTFTASGCDTDTTSIAGDAAPHRINVAALYRDLDAPSDGANSERFNSGGSPSTTASLVSCSSGTCPEQDFTYYYQLQNTYQASTNGQGPPNLDPGLSATVTGTVSGTGGSTVCTISPSSGTTTTASCSGWSDYDLPVTEPSTMSGAAPNVRWEVSGTSSFTDTTGDNTTTPTTTSSC